MFENWKLGKWMNDAYQVACEWYPDEEEANEKWILDQMAGLDENSTFYEAILDLLVGCGDYNKFWHSDNCDYVDTKYLGDCVACHIVAEFENSVVNQKVIVPQEDD